MSYTLRYRSYVPVEDLAIGECTVRATGNNAGAAWWQLWFRVLREDNGQPIDVAVPINPNGSFVEAGPGGKTWGITRTDPVSTTWIVAPSVNVLHTADLHPGDHPEPSMWHQNVAVDGVSASDLWITGAPP